MPAPACADTHPQVRQQILDRVTAGELPFHICAEPGMPSYASLYGWTRRDPNFAAALANARLRGDRSLAFDEAKARALLARLAAGEGIVSILRDPAMPSRRVYRHWRMTQGEFQGEVWRLNQVKFAERARRGAARFRPFDQALADRIVARVARGEGFQAILNNGQGLPSRNVVIRWRKAQPEFDQALKIAIRVARRRGRAAASCPAHLLEAICEGIAEGGTLNTLSALPDMPCKATLYAWMRTRPDFAAAVAEAKAARKGRKVLDAEYARLKRWLEAASSA